MIDVADFLTCYLTTHLAHTFSFKTTRIIVSAVWILIATGLGAAALFY
jgi:hypothetical protein